MPMQEILYKIRFGEGGYVLTDKTGTPIETVEPPVKKRIKVDDRVRFIELLKTIPKKLQAYRLQERKAEPSKSRWLRCVAIKAKFPGFEIMFDDQEIHELVMSRTFDYVMI